MRQLLESLYEAAVVITDRSPERLVLDWGPAAEALFGWSPAEAIGRPCAQLIRSCDFGARVRRENEARRPGRWRGRGRVYGRDRWPLRVETVRYPLPREDIWISKLTQTAAPGAAQCRSEAQTDGRQSGRVGGVMNVTRTNARQERRETVARNVRRLRLAEDLTQEEFAQRLGTTREQVGRWEHAIREPDPDSIRRICLEFDIHQPGHYFYDDPE